jgi:hypothetical protein
VSQCSAGPFVLTEYGYPRVIVCGSNGAEFETPMNVFGLFGSSSMTRVDLASTVYTRIMDILAKECFGPQFSHVNYYPLAVDAGDKILS